MTTSDELARLLAAAHDHVRSIDWALWQVPPGDARLAEHLFGNQPPLTNGLLGTYLSTCSWIWRRPIRADEGQRAATALIATWNERGLAIDFEPLLDVLSVVALSDQLLTLPPATHETMRQELLGLVPDGQFPGVDMPVPGARVVAPVEQAGVAVSTPSPLSTPDATGVALDGLYSATTFGLHLDITGPPGSGSWGSTTEFYAFFPDGTYFFFPSASEIGRHIEDPVGHKTWSGQYEVGAGTIRIYDASDGTTNTSIFTAALDGSHIGFYGKEFTRVGDTADLRPATTD